MLAVKWRAVIEAARKSIERKRKLSWNEEIFFYVFFSRKRTFILASFWSFAGRQLSMPQSFSSSSSTISSAWWALSRSMRLADGWRLWHFMTVSCVLDAVMAVVVTAGFANVVDTVVLCACTGWNLAVDVVAMVLGSDSVSVSCGISALLSSWASEYNPVISYCDSCRLKEDGLWIMQAWNGMTRVFSTRNWILNEFLKELTDDLFDVHFEHPMSSDFPHSHCWTAVVVLLSSSRVTFRVVHLIRLSYKRSWWFAYPYSAFGGLKLFFVVYL